MIKPTLFALVAIGMFSAASVFASDKACCAKQASNHEKADCVSFANLNITAEQKTKLEGWRADCMKAGCTEESNRQFLKQAKSILSKEQFAQVKAQCGKSMEKRQS
ncbi:MAG: hypothetical protein ABI871_02800 [Chthoniobacterales bacterium]